MPLFSEFEVKAATICFFVGAFVVGIVLPIGAVYALVRVVEAAIRGW